MTEPRRCPACGTEIAVDSPAGLCPKCLMKAGFESQSGAPVTAPHTPPADFVPPGVPELADRFPQLEILELLGRGGMGAVYKARHKNLDRLVAVKILPPGPREAVFAERFTREARALAKLNHPNIVSVYDFGQTSDGLFFFIMEYVDGVNLRQAIRARDMTPEQALAIVPQICDALQYAHDEGIVHRDIKPENILLDKKGRVKIADFGLAKLMAASDAELSLTGTHQVMGTLRYMAPEQMQGSKLIDHRADIYSLGVVFYELLTGELPMGRFAPPSKKVQVDVRLDEVVLRALEREPEQRWQRASEVKTEVETIRSTSGARPKVVSPSPTDGADREYARRKMIGPAVSLMVAAIVNALGATVWIAIHFDDLQTPWRYFFDLGLPIFNIVVNFILLSVAAGLIRFETSPLGEFALTCSLFTLPGFVIAIPAVILYWVRYEDPRIKAMFEKSAAPPSGPSATHLPTQEGEQPLLAGIRFFTTPQPAYARAVGVPMLLLTSITVAVAVAVSVIVPAEFEVVHLMAIGGTMVLLPIVYLALHLGWVARGKGQAQPGASVPAPRGSLVLWAGLVIVGITVATALYIHTRGNNLVTPVEQRGP